MKNKLQSLKVKKIVIISFIAISIVFAVYIYKRKKADLECEEVITTGKGTIPESEIEPSKKTTANPMVIQNNNYNLKVRGYRNNNPLNLRISSNTWKNKIPKEQNTDGSFEQFTEMKWGFRAALINIRTQVKRGKNSIASLITAWAPASDGNNPDGYAQKLVNRFPDILVSKTMLIDYNDKEVMTHLAFSMACVENGYLPQWSDIYAAWDLM